MAQVSYGTITITDTNDIERIYTVYAKSANNTTVPAATAENWKESISEAPGTGNYIWQRTVVQKSGTQEKTYSDPVCLTGEEGTDGKGITSITIKYGTSADWNTQPSSWYDNTPEYSSSTPKYWTQTTISYTSGNPTVKVTQDKALTQAIYDSVMANSLAQSANENANGAMGQAASNVNSVTRLWWSQATATPVPSISTIITDGAANRRGAWSNIRPTNDEAYPYYFYCDQTITGGGVASWSEVILDTSTLSQYQIGATNVRTKNFFKGKDSSYDGWFASGRASNEGLDEADATTYYYNARFGATNITLGYNKTPVIDLDGGNGAINIYRFPTINSNTGLVTTAGALGMKLSATDLIFYKPPVGNNSPVAAATLNASGLVLSEGGLEAGTKNTTDYIYLYSKDDATNHTLNINNSGNKSDWRIIAGNKFGVDKAGNLYASNATISGAINATSLTLEPGVTVSTNNISGLSTVATSGSYNDLDNKPTIPSLTGYIHTDGTIGSTAAEGANSFTVASSGALTASNAIIYGTLYASNGYIGGWQIGTDGNKSLHNGSSNTSPTIGSGTIILSKGLTSTTSIAGSSGSQTWTIAAGTSFGVTTAGKLYATGAEISGIITVVSGSNLSAGLSDYSTTSETQSYVTGLGYQTSNDVNTIIGQTNVSDLSDGSDYTKTINLGNTTAVQNAAKTASDYLGDTDNNIGVTLKGKSGTTTANTSTSNYIKIDSNGLEVFKAGVSVAAYGDSARIGKTNSSRFLLNADSLQAYNSLNQLYFEVSDEELKASLTEAKDVFTVGYGSAIANTTETQILNSTSGVLDLTAIPFSTNFNLTFTVFFAGYSVTLGQSVTFENIELSSSGGLAWNSVQAASWQEAAGYSGELLPSGSINLSIRQPTPGEKQINYTITITGTGLTFDYATITAVWEESAAAKDQVFLTFGSREDGISKGLFSSAMGLKVAAIGDYSHAEGYHTIASGNYSHAEGFGTQAKGDFSHVSGYGTRATIDYQSVFGKYNTEDSEAIFIVGNGTDDNNRSNLMVIGSNYIRIGNNSEASNNIQMNPNGLTINHGASSIFHVGEADSTELGYTTETFNQTITGSNSDTTITIQLGIGQTPPSGSIITLNRSYSSSAAPPYEHYTAGTSATVTNNAYTVIYDGNYTFTITVNNGYSFILYAIRYATTSTVGGKLTLGSRINTAESTFRPEIREDGFNSTTLGTGLQAYTSNQLVIGKYNKGDSTLSIATKHALIIGNGSVNSTTGTITESNALTVDWDGHINASGGITIYGHSSAIGIVVSKVGATDYTSDISSGTETWKEIGNIEVTVGRYIVFSRARFSPTNSGAHYSDINISLTPAANNNRDRRYGAGNYVNQHSYSTWVNVTESDVDANGLCKIYLNGYSTVAGSWVRDNANAFYLAAMRIM